MRPTLGVSTLDLCAQLFGLPRLASPALPLTRTRIARSPSAGPWRHLDLVPEPAAVPDVASQGMPAAVGRAAHELRCRLVGEYRRRLEVVGATLRSLDETWACDALVRVLLAEQSVDAWAAHLRSLDGRAPIAEPASDLHAVGEEVLELIASTTSRLSLSRMSAQPDRATIVPRRGR